VTDRGMVDRCTQGFVCSVQIHRFFSNNTGFEIMEPPDQ
jgi:hypothetical protein